MAPAGMSPTYLDTSVEKLRGPSKGNSRAFPEPSEKSGSKCHSWRIVLTGLASMFGVHLPCDSPLRILLTSLREMPVIAETCEKLAGRPRLLYSPVAI